MRKKLGGAPRAQSQMDAFKDAISFCDLHDMQYTGHPFTWSNGRKGLIKFNAGSTDFSSTLKGFKHGRLLKFLTFIH